MRCCNGFGLREYGWRLVLAASLAGAVAAGTEGAAAAATLDREVCRKLAHEQQALETGGVKRYLEMGPQDVAAQHGAVAVAQVRHYIALREKVLFQCPVNVLNAVAQPLADREKMAPPLPVKGPRRAALKVAPALRAPTSQVPKAQEPRAPKSRVPLPVQRRGQLGLRGAPG